MSEYPLSRAQGAFLGLALGDAYGRPLEFLTGLTVRNRRVSTDTHDFMWTDDTHMSMYLAQAVLSLKSFEPNSFGHEVGRQFSLWLDDPLTASTAPGKTCLEGARRYKELKNWQKSGVPNSDGCGAIMRVCPIGIALSGPELIASAEISACVTHGHPNAIGAAVSTTRLLRKVLEHGMLTMQMVADEAQAIRQTHPDATDVPLALEAAIHQANRREIDWLDEKSIPAGDGGWRSPSALGLALTAALHWSDDFKTAIDKAARIDGDSDSVACLTGMFLGASGGIDALPLNWLKSLPQAKDIADLAERLWAGTKTEKNATVDHMTALLKMGARFTPDDNPQLGRIGIWAPMANGQMVIAIRQLAQELGEALTERNDSIGLFVDPSLTPGNIRKLAYGKTEKENKGDAHCESQPEAYAFSDAEIIEEDSPNIESVYAKNQNPPNQSPKPIDVSWVGKDIGPGKGKIGLCMAPGKTKDRDLGQDLDRLKAFHRTDALVSLVEDQELFDLGISPLTQMAEAREIAVLRSPVLDGSPPDYHQARNIVHFATVLARAGQSVVFHCNGGKGRSGTLAACTLVAWGIDPKSAIGLTRDARSGAIENDTQLEFVFQFAEKMKQ